MTPNGPYIVTHREQAQAEFWPKGGPWRVLHREAFATLEPDALRRVLSRSPELAVAAVRDESISFARLLADLLHERRATLPNGDVIEVEATTYDRLWNQLPAIVRQALPAPPPDLAWERAVLAAWNAEHGIGIGIGARA